MTENKRFTVPVKYDLSHSKIQCNGEPLTNDELVRILNTNDGAFLENFNLKRENKELKKQMNRLYNYFMDWHSDEMGGNQFSEMWDMVKEDERWDCE